MNKVTAPSRAQASLTNFLTSPVRSTKPRPEVSIVSTDVTAVSAVTVDSAVRDADLGEVIEYLSMCRPGVRRNDSLKGAVTDFAQILPPTSFCIRLAISTSRRQACSRNDITRFMS
jgi:hypothetical protein